MRGRTELIGSGMDAAWPLIKSELNLSYSEIGLCMGLPAFLSGIVDPFTSLLGDTGRRRMVILFVGLAFSSALLLRGASSSFSLLSLILFYPASGAFVNLSQATLMDLEPRKREINMARWTFLGSSGMVAGPLILGGLLFAGWSWRKLVTSKTAKKRWDDADDVPRFYLYSEAGFPPYLESLFV